MAIPLSVGKYQPIKNTFGVQQRAGGGGGFQPGQNLYGLPGKQYGGKYMYPNMGVQGGGAPVPAKDQQGATGGVIPTIKLPHDVPAVAAFTPDYASMIGGSYEVSAAESAMAAQMAAARAQFQAQLRSSFIDLGYSGDMKEGGLGDFSKYIDKDTIQKAIDNKYSAYAQVKQQEAKTNAANDALLASSGLSLGGTTTATATDTINQAEQARYEGLRNFLSGGQQGLSNLTNLKLQLAQGVAQARAAAAARLAQMYPPTPGTPAQPVDWGDFWGSYQGGTFSLPGSGGYITQSGIPGDQGQAQPWFVSGASAGPSWGNWSPGWDWKVEPYDYNKIPDYNF
jgi:hypothetical protein